MWQPFARAAARNERAAIAGRARARKRAADALLAGVSGEQLTELDRLLTIDPMTCALCKIC
jgi:hypothetical protein